MDNFPVVDNLVQMTLFRAEHNKNDCYLKYVNELGDIETSLSYSELDHFSRSIASKLQNEDLEQKTVILLYAPGVEYVKTFFACLYAGAIPVPAYPPMGARDITRLVNVVRDCRAAAVLSSSDLKPMIEAWVANAGGDVEIGCYATDKFDLLSDSDNFVPYNAAPEETAFLQYTSGSTGHPKGVMISHGNLLANFLQIVHAFMDKDELDKSPSERIKDLGQQYNTVIWLPPFHDMGLIGGLLTPVFAGATVGLMSPLTFLKNPFIWLKTISDMKAAVSGGPNFSYQYCARKITQEQIEQLDLSNWKVAFNGAEPINTDSLDQFTQTFSSCGFEKQAFLPCYGLAEATLFVSGSPTGRGVKQIGANLKLLGLGTVSNGNVNNTQLVSSGVLAEGTEVRIVDPVTNKLCNDGRVGEIWINGPTVAKGYWGKPSFSEKVFNARIADCDHQSPNGYLRSGDLGVLKDGELYVTGRIKELIIVAGKNHYPQDIELTLQQTNTGFRKGCGAAFSISCNGKEDLVIMQEVSKTIATTDGDNLNDMVNRGIREVAARHGIRPVNVVLINQGGLPKTSSGKIQRCEAKKLYQAGNVVPVFTWQSNDSSLTESNISDDVSDDEYIDLHQQLNGEMKKWVGEKLNVAPHLIDLSVPFSELGVDSIEAIELVDRLQDALHRTIPATEMMRYPTVKALLDSLANEMTEHNKTKAMELDTAQA